MVRVVIKNVASELVSDEKASQAQLRRHRRTSSCHEKDIFADIDSIFLNSQLRKEG